MSCLLQLILKIFIGKKVKKLKKKKVSCDKDEQEGMCLFCEGKGSIGGASS